MGLFVFRRIFVEGGKRWFQSKTIAFNGFILLSAIVGVLGSPGLLDFVELLPESWRAWLLAVIPFFTVIGNVVLRLVTREPIVGKVAAPEQVEAENK